MCPMKAKERAELLVDYCAKRLVAERAAEFESHIETCEECRSLVNSQQTVWRSLDEWAPVSAPETAPEFNARLYARIEAEQCEPLWRRLLTRATHPANPWTLYWKPAVSLAAACGILAVGLTIRVPTVHPASSSAEMHANKVDIEQVEKTLEDLDMLTPSAAPGRPM